MLKDTLVQDVDLFLLKPLMVSKYQLVIMHHLTQALADQKAGKNARANLMKGVMGGDIQAWLGVTGPDDARRIVGMIFTTISADRYLDVRRLVVYGLHMKEQLSPDAMIKAMDRIVDHAKKSGCSSIIAQTNVRGISRLLERHGWTNGQAVLTKEL